jgi:hypothetical protein
MSGLGKVEEGGCVAGLFREIWVAVLLSYGAAIARASKLIHAQAFGCVPVIVERNESYD